MGPGGYSGSQPPVAFKQTPLIVQYLSVKQRVPDAILFFRLGDFYETFEDDAHLAEVSVRGVNQNGETTAVGGGSAIVPAGFLPPAE